ncbi:MAG TPA: IucA/IucC family protein, partial [Trichocoleus sp.]
MEPTLTNPVTLEPCAGANSQTVQATDKQIAEYATLQSFLNCYLRETNIGERLSDVNGPLAQVLARTSTREMVQCTLTQQRIHILAGVRYWSLTGRHLFAFPVYYQPSDSAELLELDYVTLAALVTKELALTKGSGDRADELLLRVIQSCQNIEHFVRSRRSDVGDLYGWQRSFLQTEQSLIFGHHLHPTPKSRQGFSEEERAIYSPELQGQFALHYFRAHHAIIQQGSALPRTATDLIKAQLQADPAVDAEFKAIYCQQDEYALIPVHPWQANYLRHQPAVQQLMQQGVLQDLGIQGQAFRPTSSIRTVYHPDAAFMFKLSLSIKVTNSVRTNLYKELERGVEVARLLDSPIGQDLRLHFPRFDIVRDPAYVTVALPGETEASSFAAILRVNPFEAAPETDATCLIALCQDAIAQTPSQWGSSRLAHIIQTLADKEQRSTAEVSVDWFRRYLQISLKPILWLYFTYGIAVEAHQQNSLLQLQEGYPDRFFYRDNQGYYYRQSFHHLLNSIFPGISQTSQTVCADAIADERLTYYFFINNLFGLINAFG